MNDRAREYAEMVDDTVVFPVLRAARDLLLREGADASHLDWVPDGIWPVVPVEPAPNPWRYGGIDRAWLTGGVPVYSTAMPPARPLPRGIELVEW